MDKYKNKYRIQSNRKPNWDYSSDGLYFLTFVTQHRVCNLGKIVNNEIALSKFGQIVEKEWFKSFEIRKELVLHEFVIMPNHLHAIVEIYNKNRDDITGNSSGIDTHGRASLTIDPIDPNNPINSIDKNESNESNNPNEPTVPELSSIKRNPIVRLPKSISSFIAGYKSAVNTKIDDYIDQHQLNIPKYNKNNHFFQPNYHDHIIRNLMEYHSISNYIINNPINWGKDKFRG
jgi:putative transposase